MPKAGLFDDWGCDAAPSVPTPVPEGFVKVSMGGFCFHEGGIGVDVTATEVEAMSHPPLGPTSMRDDSGRSVD